MTSDEQLEDLFARAETPRAPSAPLQGTESAALAIARVKYSHDAMIDLIIARPEMKQGEIAKHFGYTQPWVSRIMNSDAFLARLAQRKADIVDPSISLSVNEKLAAAASRSLDIVLEKLEHSPNLDQALGVVAVTSKALGYGARQANLNVQNNFVVALPQKAASAEEWAGKYSGQSPGLQAMVAAAKCAVDANPAPE